MCITLPVRAEVDVDDFDMEITEPYKINEDPSTIKLKPSHTIKINEDLDLELGVRLKYNYNPNVNSLDIMGAFLVRRK